MSDPWSAAQRTLDHYRSNAQAFREGTREHDVSQNIDALLRHIRAELPCASLISVAVLGAISGLSRREGM